MNTRTWLSGCAGVVALSASFVTFTGGAAYATRTSEGGGGLLNDTLTNLLGIVTAPASTGPTSETVRTAGNTGTTSGQAGTSRTRQAVQPTGQSGIASGNLISAPISLPITVCGNGVAVLGEASAYCDGGATGTAVTDTADRKSNDTAGRGRRQTDDGSGLLSGNTVSVPIAAPINICGNAVSVLGESMASCPRAAAGVPGVPVVPVVPPEAVPEAPEDEPEGEGPTVVPAGPITRDEGDGAPSAAKELPVTGGGIGLMLLLALLALLTGAATLLAGQPRAGRRRPVGVPLPRRSPES